MFDRDDPAHLLGQDLQSVVARIADASVRGDVLQLAETRQMFVLVSARAAQTLPPTGGRFTASLMLGPVAALARRVEEIDEALVTIFDWLVGKPTFVLRALGRRLDEAERQAADAQITRTPTQDAHIRRAIAQASVDIMLGITPCRMVACSDELQIRFLDPQKGRYLTLAHLPYDPDWSTPALDPTPELTA